MVPQRRGKRGAARRRNAAKRSTGHQTRSKETPIKPKEQRMLIQLVLCGSVFVLLVAVKLLLPARMEHLRVGVGHAIEQNIDVQAVFSAVGRAFSGESEIITAANEVYQAVFSVEDEAVATSSQILVGTESEAALDTLQNYRSEPEDLLSMEQEEKIEASSLSYVLYSGQNLPEGVSMEQVILGFDYCIPVTGELSSRFGYREHPLEGEEKFHYGIDLVAETGTEIRCFADGMVTAAGESSSYGKYCIVEHENGYSTLYAHCDRITTSSGAKVHKGDTIAKVGETGMATGPHLHFELQHDGTYLNPIYYVSKL